MGHMAMWEYCDATIDTELSIILRWFKYGVPSIIMNDAITILTSYNYYNFARHRVAIWSAMGILYF